MVAADPALRVAACAVVLLAMAAGPPSCAAQQLPAAAPPGNLDSGAAADTEALLLFAQSVANANSTILADWQPDTDVCAWSGITCSAEARVVKVNVSNAGLVGSLPRHWGAPGLFSHVQMLNTSFNNLTGQLPESWGQLGAFQALRNMSLGNNSLTGPLPATWGAAGAFPQLQLLLIYDTSIDGTIPDSWATPGGFPELVDLEIYENPQLSGTLPSSWGQPGLFLKLSELDLWGNNISGSMPPGWFEPGSFPGLHFLDVHANHLTGTLPAELVSAKMVGVDVSNNELTGTLPQSWSTGAILPEPLTINLANNSFKGPLPAHWPQQLPNLEVLSVGGNLGLAGAIPLAWLDPGAFPHNFLLDVGSQVWARSLGSDAWRKAVCLSAARYTGDGFQRLSTLLGRYQLVTAQLDYYDQGLGNETYWLERNAIDAVARSSYSSRAVPLKTLCRNADAPVLLSVIWALIGASIVLIIACYLLVLSSSTSAVKAGQCVLVRQLWDHACCVQLKGVISGMAGGFAYWADVITDLWVISEVWGSWPGYVLLSLLMAEYVITSMLLLVFWGTTWHHSGTCARLPRYATWLLMVLSQPFMHAVLDILAMLDIVGLVRMPPWGVDADGWFTTKGVLAAACRTLPTAIVQSAIFAVGNNPSIGLFLSTKTFALSLVAAGAVMARQLVCLLYRAWAGNMPVAAALRQVWTGQLLRLQPKRSARADSCAALNPDCSINSSASAARAPAAIYIAEAREVCGPHVEGLKPVNSEASGISLPTLASGASSKALLAARSSTSLPRISMDGVRPRHLTALAPPVGAAQVYTIYHHPSVYTRGTRLNLMGACVGRRRGAADTRQQPASLMTTRAAGGLADRARTRCGEPAASLRRWCYAKDKLGLVSC